MIDLLTVSQERLPHEHENGAIVATRRNFGHAKNARRIRGKLALLLTSIFIEGRVKIRYRQCIARGDNGYDEKQANKNAHTETSIRYSDVAQAFLAFVTSLPL